MKPWCLLLTGMPNSGKSTIAYHLVQKRIRNVLIIDGDKHREMQFLGRTLGFSKKDIMDNTEHVIKLAKFAMDQGINVIIAQIAPYKDQKDLMRKEIDNFTEVQCDCSKNRRSLRPNFVDSDLEYEIGNPDLILNTDELTIEECGNLVLKQLFRSGINENRFVYA